MLQCIIGLFVTVFLSAIIGCDRERAEKDMGLRTSILVSLTGFIFTYVGIHLSEWIAISHTYDGGRVIAYLLVGMAFLGASIKGFTTAALLLPLIGIGVLCGIGQWGLAIIFTVIIYGVLKLKPIEDKWLNK